MRFRTVLSTCVLCLLVIFPTLSHAQSYDVRLGKKKVLCEIINDKAVAVVKVGKKTVAMGQQIKNLKKAIKKAKSPAKIASLSRSMAILQAGLKKSNRACVTGRPPSATPTPEATVLPDHLSLETYSGTVDRKTIQRLLELAAYGTSSREEAIISTGLSSGLRAAVDSMMTVRAEPEGLASRVLDRADGTLNNLNTQLRSNFSASNMARGALDFAVNTNNPYHSNFQYFLADLFTAGTNVLDTGDKMHLWLNYWNILWETAVNPNLGLALERIGKDPLMLLYLDGSKNKYTASGAAVNENYGRELLELFSIAPTRPDPATGSEVPNYVEDIDGNRRRGHIFTLAQLLSGWAVVPLVDGDGITQYRAVFSEADSYPGSLSLFEGTNYAFTASDHDSVVRGIFANHPAVAGYYAKEILEWYLTPNPDPALVKGLADLIKQNNFDLKEPLAKLFTSKAFYDARYKNTLPKTSTQAVVELSRSMELYRTAAVAANQEGGVSISTVSGSLGSSGSLLRIGHDITTPPTVFSFQSNMWSSAATLVETVNMYFTLTNDTTTQGRISWSPASLVPGTPAYAPAVIDGLLARFGCSDMSNSQRQQLEFYMDHTRSGATYTRNPFDNLNINDVRAKVPNAVAIIASQTCFLTK